jgi:hypothetical protein
MRFAGLATYKYLKGDEVKGGIKLAISGAIRSMIGAELRGVYPSPPSRQQKVTTPRADHQVEREKPQNA